MQATTKIKTILLSANHMAAHDVFRLRRHRPLLPCNAPPGARTTLEVKALRLAASLSCLFVSATTIAIGSLT